MCIMIYKINKKGIVIQCLFDLFYISFFVSFVICYNFSSSFLLFLTKFISHEQKSSDAKVVKRISRRQKWNSYWQFAKKLFFQILN